MDLDRFVDQALAVANNYLCTGRPELANGLILQVLKVDPDNFLARKMLGSSSLVDHFGEQWLGENLDGKSIEIFCDQGMGDTLILLRYLGEMKRRWNCKIVLNCYPFYDQFRRFMELVPCVDVFVNWHNKCDYHTNIMGIPAILIGLHLDVYYPAHWAEIRKHPIPEQITLLGFAEKSQSCKIGIAWKSNVCNPTSQARSIPADLFLPLKDFGLVSIIPHEDHPSYIQAYVGKDLLDTVNLIYSLDAIVTVDTVVLHLAGLIKKPTYVLLPCQADPRWGEESETIWYPSVKLFRQQSDLDWTIPISQVARRLTNDRLCNS